MTYKPGMTDHEEWVDDARDLIKVIIQDADLTNDFQDVEKEAMRNLMEMVRELNDHLDTPFPTICKCEDNECKGWQLGNDHAFPDEVRREGS